MRIRSRSTRSAPISSGSALAAGSMTTRPRPARRCGTRSSRSPAARSRRLDALMKEFPNNDTLRYFAGRGLESPRRTGFLNGIATTVTPSAEELRALMQLELTPSSAWRSTGSRSPASSRSTPAHPRPPVGQSSSREPSATFRSNSPNRSPSPARSTNRPPHLPHPRRQRQRTAPRAREGGGAMKALLTLALSLPLFARAWPARHAECSWPTTTSSSCRGSRRPNVSARRGAIAVERHASGGAPIRFTIASPSSIW